MPQIDTSFPPAAPTVADGKVTVDMLLNQPLRLTRRIANLALERMVTDRIFAAGAPAVGGAVIFDRILENDLYPGRDVQEIEPGSEFPILTDSEATPEVKAVAKRGGADYVTYEAKRRNQTDVVTRKLTRISNAIARKCDRVSLAALNADTSLHTVTGTDWSNTSTRNALMDVFNAVNYIDALDLGYVADTVLINPMQETEMFADPSIREQMPREAASNPVVSGRLGNLLGLTWLKSNAVPLGTAYVLQSKTVGSWHDEVPLYTRVTDQPERERFLLQAARVGVPVITDPLAVVRLQGL